VAVAFISDLRRLASHASAVGEDTLGDLRRILDEALTRIRNEVFQPESGRGQAGPEEAGPEEAGPEQDDPEQDDRGQAGHGQHDDAPAPPGDAPADPKSTG
jgi:hypothetical protein